MKELKTVGNVGGRKRGSLDGKVKPDRRDPEQGGKPDGMEDDIVHPCLGPLGPPGEESKRPRAHQKPDPCNGDETD